MVKDVPETCCPLVPPFFCSLCCFIYETFMKRLDREAHMLSKRKYFPIGEKA